MFRLLRKYTKDGWWATLLGPIFTVAEVVVDALIPLVMSDIIDKGIVLTGGGALLKNLDILLREETGLPVLIADDPLTCVVMGSGKALDQIDLLRGVTTI